MTESETTPRLSACSDGATVTVTVRNEDGGPLVEGVESGTRIVFTDPPPGSSDRRTVAATVRKAVDGHGASSDMVVLEPTSVRESTIEGEETRTGSGESDRPESTSNDRREATEPGDSERAPTTGSLDEIAAELIGDREFTVSEDEESVVGEAKERARSQGRDPAIDPKLDDV